jgi:hypothetical protein
MHWLRCSGAALAIVTVARMLGALPLMRPLRRLSPRILVPLFMFAAAIPIMCRGGDSVETQLRELIEENQRLQSQIREQQQTIESFRAKLDELARAGERRDKEVHELSEHLDEKPSSPHVASVVSEVGRQVRLSGEAEIGWFRSGGAGAYPSSGFKVDDAKLFLESPVWKNVYFYSELDLTTREQASFQLGELYLDFEDVGSFQGDRLLNVRVGRQAVPFGEEYQTRTGVDNPLISHSVSDVWAFDTGVMVYGEVDQVRYAFAVQNGGPKVSGAHDLNQAFTGRIQYDPRRWLHLSASGMITGNLRAQEGGLSELWFGNGFFRSIGSASSTRRFHADLAELDAAVRWASGHLSANLGRAWYDDDDLAGGNARRLTYYGVEAVESLDEHWFAAARFSEIQVPRGYPLVGQGDFGRYFFRSPLTDRLWRLSLGAGYRFGPPLVVKAEYSFEGGTLVGGAKRDSEDLLSTEIGLKF